MKNITVRRGQHGDVKIIARFNTLMAKETEGLELARDTILSGVKAVMTEESHGYYLIAEVDGEIAACMMITYEWSDWRNGQFWWIQSVYVDIQYRRMGIFKTLYNRVKEQAQLDRLCVGLRLYVEQSNGHAQKTYHALGMKKTRYNLFEYLI